MDQLVKGNLHACQIKTRAGHDQVMQALRLTVHVEGYKCLQAQEVMRTTHTSLAAL